VSLPEIPEILEFLRSAEPEMLEQMGEGALLAAFRSAAAEVPAYADFLRRRGVDAGAVMDLASFRARVPLTDKPTMFQGYPLHELFRGGTLAGIKSFVPSSGTSGTFAFSGDTAEGFQLAAKGADLAFEYVVGFSKRRTLLVNTYPMGLQVPTSMAVANTGVNADVALAMIRACAPYFEQLVIVSQPPFAKFLIEAGSEAGLDWKRYRTSLVTGGEGFVETWRTYMSRLLGIDDADSPSGAYIASTMGAGELGLNLFHEIPETIRIIRRAFRDAAFRTRLLGMDTPHTPHFFVFYPMRSFIEEIPVAGSPVGELAVSLASPDLPMPHFRYRTGDLVRVIPYRRIEEVLGGHAADLPLPGLRLPCVAVFGRRDTLDLGGEQITAEALKEALFLDEAVARAVTGFFGAAAGTGSRLTLDVQLRRNFQPTAELADRLGGALKSFVPDSLVTRVHLFETDRYPHPTTYERKTRYLLH
jgi:phenylacetate-CoA ligase